ncbi:MAG TPA: thioredoxin domain-containing protein [Myxococcus sp.]|nr:thioredoxin domain-containing protein [Myxococcus sp.]
MRASIIHVVRRAAGALGLALLVWLPAAGCKERTQLPPPGDVERTWVPLSGLPLRGPATARVTLLVFCDFQSPYCARASERLREVQREYGDAVRIQYRHNPLPIYPHSQVAAEASVAAAEQGQFWRYHDVLFSRQHALDRASLEKYAAELGLDLARFRDALDTERARLKVDADAILASKLQARGTPVFYVNGRPVRFLVEPPELKRIIDEELVLADTLLDNGVDPKELYQRVARAPVTSTPEPSEPAAAAVPESPRGNGLPGPETVYKVEVGTSPVKGPADAKVTVVLWSDFECARCASFESDVLNPVAAAFGKDVRIVWKFRPVPDHPGAMLASEAALAADREGKFWKMRDLLFSDPTFERERLEAHARKLGLDSERFRAALDERDLSVHVGEDLDLSERIAIRNLPTLFVNGKRLEYGGGGRGQPSELLTAEVLRAHIQEALADAEARLKAGTARAGLYASIIGGGLDDLGPRLSELPPLPPGEYKVEVGDSPVRGPKDAPITIVTLSDFECPYCVRLEKTLAKVREHYGDKVRIVWKDAPGTEYHKEAMGAHEAARAAGEQGRFWEMHDLLFSRPLVLHRAMYERYAAQLGLDLEKFRAALDSGKFRAAIQKEAEYGINLAGPGGTPTVFVNGRLMLGAYPFESFRQVIDAELARLEKPAQGTRSASRE